MTIRAITFDVGGTLLYPQPGVAEMFRTVAGEFGYDIPEDDARRLAGEAHQLYERLYAEDGDFWCSNAGCEWIWHTQYAYLCDACHITEDKQAIIETMYERYLHGENWRFYSDALPALSLLHEAGYRLAVVSNWAGTLGGILQDLGLAQYFEIILASGDVGLRKPNPAFFTEAAALLNLEPAEILHVGDLDREDRHAPQEVGCQSLIIDRSNSDNHVGLQVITDLRHIIDYARS